MQFTLNGVLYDLDRELVEGRLIAVHPEPVREHAVRVGDVLYPVKQAFEVGAGIKREDFTSQTARRHLARLGFTVLSGGAGAPPGTPVSPRQSTPDPVSAKPGGWPWEGHVQALFGAALVREGWLVTSMADTATKAHGVDVLASKGDRRLGAEVKGWPSTGYADPRRASEVKRTQPSTQAGHWFSQALMKAMMLLDSHPDHESLVVLPDYPRYRDLTTRTARGRSAAGVHVAFVSEAGRVESETWTA